MSKTQVQIKSQCPISKKLQFAIYYSFGIWAWSFGILAGLVLGEGIFPT